MRIEVAGIPAPQGSKRHVGGGRMVEQSRAVGPWREAVRAETQRGVERFSPDSFPYPGPVRVALRFRLPRPKSLPKSVTHHTKQPDLDKLTRAVLDGLVAGGALRDDSQVVFLNAWKRYAASDGAAPGCSISIEEAE